jgi:Zn-dependent protease
MKNTGKIFGIIVLAMVILFTAAACSVSAPSGTYSYTEVPSWTITFGPGTFTMFVPASVSPSEENITANGTFVVSGKSLLLSGLDQPMSFTITNSKTLTESDGSKWIKQ